MIRNVWFHNLPLKQSQTFFFTTNRKNNGKLKKYLESILINNSVSLRNNICSISNEISSDAAVAKLINVDAEKYKKKIDLLKNYNFKQDNCFQMIQNYPSLLEIPDINFENALREWKTSISNFESFQFLILNQPLFLSVEAEEIRKRIYYFKGLCKNRNTLINFFNECPNVLFDDLNSIYLKVEYLLKQKRVERHQLFHSKALKKQLDFIKGRIELLEKCGMYETIITYPHKINKNQIHSNPQLKDILDTDDETFSKKIAGITLEEYLAYNELFQMSYLEINEDEDIASDSN